MKAMNTVPHKTLYVSKEFSVTPGPRSEDEGDYSGDVFRVKHLVPFITEAIKDGAKLVVNLDGTAGYGTSFLEEAFGGLVRNEGFTHEQLDRVLTIVSKDEPYLIDDILEYIREASSDEK